MILLSSKEGMIPLEDDRALPYYENERERIKHFPVVWLTMGRTDDRMRTPPNKDLDSGNWQVTRCLPVKEHRAIYSPAKNYLKIQTL